MILIHLIAGLYPLIYQTFLVSQRLLPTLGKIIPILNLELYGATYIIAETGLVQLLSNSS